VPSCCNYTGPHHKQTCISTLRQQSVGVHAEELILKATYASCKLLWTVGTQVRYLVRGQIWAVVIRP